MNEVQINKIKKRAYEYATSCFPYEKQFLEREAVVKCCVHVVTETIAELEKENAELKSENQKWKDEWQEQVQKATDEGYARTLQTIQLTNAKELLKNILAISVHDKRQCTYDAYILTVKQANQFLNSEVEK